MNHLNSDEFKVKFKKYRQGTLTEEEEERFEDELEKLDEYQAILETETRGRPNKNDYNPETERRILKRSQMFAYFRIGLSSLVTALLILPTLNLFTSIYYSSGGHSSKINVLQQVTETVIPITNPNVQLENQKKTRELFQVNYSFDLYKRVGKEKSFIVSDSVRLILHDVRRERGVIPTGAINNSLDTKAALDRLSRLPNGTVVEIFIAFDEPQETDTIDKMRNQYDMDILWRAVKTDDADIENQHFIGYPENFRHLHEDKSVSAEEEFETALAFLSKHEKLAEDISNNMGISAKERLNYIKKNGVSIIGLSITGPSQEIVSFIEDQNKRILNVYIGDENLWNWQTEN